MNQEGNSELEQRSLELSINEVQSNENDPVVIDVDVPSEDLAERMANAFDKNLDKLIEDVQAPPPPVKIKKPKKVKGVKVKKVKEIKIKLQRYQPIQGKDPNFNAFIGRKIMSSFSLAATARRNAKLAGEAPKPKGYFLKKALGFEFGGDLINRTKGSFSNDPTAEQDPSLSKGERFAAKLQRPDEPLKAKTTSSPVKDPYTQPSLFDTNKYVTVVDNSLGQQIQKAVKKLQTSFERVDKSLSNLSLDKDKAKQQVSQENTIIEILSEKFIQVKESIKESNVLQKTLNTLKLKSLNLIKQAADKREAAAREAALEQGADNSSVQMVEDPYKKKGKGLLEKAWDFIAGNDDEEDDDSCDCGPGVDIDLPDGPSGKPRRRGARRRLARRKFNAGKRKIADGIRRTGEKIAEKGGRAGKFIQRQGGKALDFGRRIGGKALDAGKTGLTKAGKFFAENPKMVKLGKAFGGFGAKAIPGVGALTGGADAAYRASRGDKIGAGIAGFGAAADAVAAGAAGTIIGAPVAAVATAVSWGADIALLGKDIFDIFSKPDNPDKPKKKMSEGGVVKLSKGGMVPAMVGEAGPELITPANPFLSLGNLIGGGDPAAASIATILGATDSVIESAGPSAAALKPFISQTISPLAKIYGKPELNLDTKVGNNLGNVKEPDKDGGILGLFKKLIGFFTGGGSGGDDEDAKVPTQPPTPPGGDATDMIGGARLFMGEGFPPLAAAILSGNVQQESGWKGQRTPWVLNDGAGTNKGLISWNRSRIVNAEKFLGKPLETATNGEQVKWIKEELRQYGLLDEFMNPNSSEQQLKEAAYKYIGWGDTGARWEYSKQIHAALLRGEQGTFTTSGSPAKPMPASNPSNTPNPLSSLSRGNVSTKSNTQSGSTPIVPIPAIQQNSGAGSMNLFNMNSGARGLTVPAATGYGDTSGTYQPQTPYNAYLTLQQMRLANN